MGGAHSKVAGDGQAGLKRFCEFDILLFIQVSPGAVDWGDEDIYGASFEVFVFPVQMEAGVAHLHDSLAVKFYDNSYGKGSLLAVVTFDDGYVKISAHQVVSGPYVSNS